MGFRVPPREQLERRRKSSRASNGGTHRSAGEAIAVLCSSSSPDATVFRYSDAPRTEAKDAVDTLRKRGQTVRMLTGDATASALAIAEQVGIEPAAVFSQLTPDKKLAHVESAREDGKKEENGKVVSVAMIGDGINDAPALAAADVGIAVCSTPSDAASSAADVLLLPNWTRATSKQRHGGWWWWWIHVGDFSSSRAICARAHDAKYFTAKYFLGDLLYSRIRLASFVRRVPAFG